LEIKKTHYGENHVEYASTLHDLANILGDLGDHETAKLNLLKVLEINKAHYGENHEEYARTLYNLAIRLRDLGDHETAK
jgi:tetratricopeptide (TPR) repeat protein